MRLLPMLAVLAVGCTGKDEECEEFDVIVTVVNPTGEPVPDATVELLTITGLETIRTACPANGDGTYKCTGSIEEDNQQISAVHAAYTNVSQKVVVPATCDKPTTMTLTLGVMMGA
jgi:hypothetical protein